MTDVFRFAPSPNGELHLGHAYSALLNARLARERNGRLLLRMEDIDTERCTPALEAAALRDLEWLGLRWESPVRRQSEHLADYRAVLDRLIDRGLVYPAFMSRGAIRAFIADTVDRGASWPRDPDGVPLYPAADRQLSQRERRRRIDAGEPFAWRLDTAAAIAETGRTLSWLEHTDETLAHRREIAADPAAWGDVILARRDIATSYHLSVVVDDALQGITHVVRGLDLYASTAVHRLLQTLLDLPAPTYFHHRLILDEDGRKLSKSLGHTGLRVLREAGASPGDVLALLGLPAVFSPSERSRP